MNFPKNLRYLRKRSGLRQDDMLAVLRITRSTWSNYEIGHTIPKLTEVISISKFFGISLDKLVMEDLESIEPLPKKKGQREPREYPLPERVSKVSEPDFVYVLQELNRLRDEVAIMKGTKREKEDDSETDGELQQGSD
jgi:transcriptional regulator with XRE-family HTH domain